MQSISSTFTRAASGEARIDPGFSVFWMMVFAIAILDDAERREREKKRRRERQALAQPQPRPRPPAAPRPF